MPNNNWTEFKKSWAADNNFILKTSGSTGSSKNIELSKSQLVASAKLTIDLLNITFYDTIYCCLPLDKIGGFMQMVRAKVVNCKIVIAKPNTNPISELNPNHKLSFISLTPHMLFNGLEMDKGIDILNKFKGILIGGGEINMRLLKKLIPIKTPIFHTYGMTETCSHIAVKRLNKHKSTRYFKPLKGINIKQNKDNCLIINGAITNNIDVLTNDIVKISADNTFVVLGRKDFVINTGGVKYCAEEIEKFLLPFTKNIGKFMVYGKKHKSLGEQVCLLAEPQVFNHNEIMSLTMPKHLKYANIKSIKEGAILLTSNGKIDRINSLKLMKEAFNN